MNISNFDTLLYRILAVSAGKDVGFNEFHLKASCFLLQARLRDVSPNLRHGTGLVLDVLRCCQAVRD